MKHLFMLPVLAAFLSACSVSQAAPDAELGPESESLPIPKTMTDTRPATTQFADVLAEYQNLNARLDRVAARLRRANAELCPLQTRDPGFTTHRLEDYPDRLHPIATELMGLQPGGLYVRAVRRGTSADKQGLQAGDRIVAVNGNRFSPDAIMSAYNDAVWQQGFEAVLSKITIDTGAREFTARIRSQTTCDIPANVIYSDDVNGHTDGAEVLVTSALMQTVADDNNLALIVAHEMAHAVAGHASRTPSQALELEADRMALVLMARAGFDIDAAVARWRNAAHPHDGGTTHPNTTERYENFERERLRIANVQDTQTLGFK